MNESRYNNEMLNLRRNIDQCDYRLALEFAAIYLNPRLSMANVNLLLEERLEYCVRIGLLKNKHNREIKVNGREQEVINNYQSVFREYELNPRLAKTIAEMIMQESRELQKDCVIQSNGSSVSSSP